MEILKNIGLYHYLTVALLVFCIGVWGLINSHDYIKKALCFLIILNAIGLNFISFALYIDSNNLSGFITELFIVVFTIIQSVILGVLLFKINKKSININDKNFNN